MKYSTSIYGINAKSLPIGYKDGLQMCLDGARCELQRLIKEPQPIVEWDAEKEDKVKYLNKSIEFFIMKLEELR